MKILYIPFKEILYETKPFDTSLCDSIQRIAFSFPIKVEKTEIGYRCIDGNKRLSAVKWLNDQQNVKRDFSNIPAIIISDARTDNGWSRKRHH